MPYNTSRTRAKAIRARKMMSDATASDQLKFTLDLVQRCTTITELRQAIKAAGITAPAYYQRLPELGPKEHRDKRRGQPSWTL
jgi:hypothetical protein